MTHAGTTPAAAFLIDAALPDLSTLRAALPAGAEVVWVDPAREGLAEAVSRLSGEAYALIGILGHGEAGVFHLGRDAVDAAYLSGRPEAIAALGDALAPDGELHLYGCRVAAGETGEAFVAALAEATGAVVGASDDITGAGGDWELEVATAPLRRPVLEVPGYAGALATITGGSNSSSGAFAATGALSDFGYSAETHKFVGATQTTGITVTKPGLGDGQFGGGSLSFSDTTVQVTGAIPSTLIDYWGGAVSVGVDADVVRLNRNPFAGNIFETADEDGGEISINGLQSASDPDGDSVSLVDVGSTSAGTVSSSGNTIFFTPNANFNGTASFSYSVRDDRGKGASGTVQVDVQGVDDAPDAQPDAADVHESGYQDTGTENGELSVTNPTQGVLYNDDVDVPYTDDDDTVDTLSVTAAAAAGETTAPLSGGSIEVAGTYGTLTLNDDGTYDYAFDQTDPEVEALSDGDTLTDAFDYDMQDGDGETSSSTLTITINGSNDAPVLAADSATTDEDASVLVDALANDADPAEGDALTLVSVGAPSDGGTAVIEDGQIRYTPAEHYNSEFESDPQDVTISYTVEDAAGSRATETLTVTVDAVNDAPVAADDANSVTEASGQENAVPGAAATGDANLLDDDTDIDFSREGDSHSVASVEGTAVSGEATHTVPIQGEYGQLMVSPNGAFSYVLDEANATVDALTDGESLQDVFGYTVEDAGGLTDDAELTVTINGANDTPVIADDTASTDEDQAVTIDVTANDVDKEGPLTITSVDAPSNGRGTAQIVDNKIVFTPAPDFNSAYAEANGGPEPVTIGYTVDDGDGLTDTGTATVTVNAVNDDPVANDDSMVHVELSGIDNADAGGFDSGVVNLLDNDADIDLSREGDTLTVTQVEGEAISAETDFTGLYGTLTVAPDGAVSYAIDEANADVEALAQDETLTDSFSYTMEDAAGAAPATASIDVIVTGRNDGPRTAADVNVTEKNGPAVTGNVLENDGDPEGDALSVIGWEYDGVTDSDLPALSGSPSRQTLTAPADSETNAGAGSFTVETLFGTLTLQSDGGYSFVADRGPFLPAASFEEVVQYRVSDGEDDKLETLTLTIENPFAGGGGNEALTAGDEGKGLFGLGGHDRLSAGDGDNLLDGGDGNDGIRAGDGNNEAHGGDGRDRISLGDGDNLATGGVANDRITVGDGDNEVYGNEGSDVLRLGDGNNKAYGGESNDRITVGHGDNEVYGNEGNDVLTLGDGNNKAFGGESNDRIVAGDGDNEVHGGDGSDQIMLGDGDNDVQAGAANDMVRSGDGDNVIETHGGFDRVTVGDGDNRILLGDDRDTLRTGDGDNEVFGGAGNDLMFLGRGDDLVEGGAGRDIIRADKGADVVDGGAGDDRINLGRDDDVDTLIFNDVDNGDDMVRNFDVDGDLIDVSATGVTDFDGQIMISAGRGRSTVIEVEGHAGSVTLRGVRESEIDVDNFVFAEESDPIILGRPDAEFL